MNSTGASSSFNNRTHSFVGAIGACTQSPPLLSLMTTMRTLVVTLLKPSDCGCSKVHMVPLTISRRMVLRSVRGPRGNGKAGDVQVAVLLLPRAGCPGRRPSSPLCPSRRRPGRVSRRRHRLPRVRPSGRSRPSQIFWMRSSGPQSGRGLRARASTAFLALATRSVRDFGSWAQCARSTGRIGNDVKNVRGCMTRE
jgi:hypothetical protein